jgi:pantoate--beta-alanine ligase
VAEVESGAREALSSAGFRLDYFSVRRASDLGLANDDDTDLVVLVAARLGRARLIDNLQFHRPRRVA